MPQFTRDARIWLLVALCLTGGTHVRASLVAYWPLDNSTANVAVPTPAGALGGDAAFSTAQVAPVIGGTHSLVLDGNGDHFAITGAVDLANLASLVRNDFTISLWGRSDVSAANLGTDLRYLFDFGAAHGAGMGMVFNRNHGSWGANPNTIGFYYGNQAVSSGVTGLADTWYHLALTRSGNDMTIYVDGTASATQSIGPATIDYSTAQEGSRGPLVFGDQAKTGSRDWDGYLDDIAVWDQALLPDQIQSLANGSRLPTEITTSWRFENQTFTGTVGPAAVGPWIEGARWRYKTNSAVTNHNYASADLNEFPDLGYYYSGTDSGWSLDNLNVYPDVRTSNKTLHPGNTNAPTRDAVIAWESDFEGFVDVQYESVGGGSLGYQVLQWDASGNQMRVLQQRATHGGSGYAPRQIHTRVEPGDQILYVLDNDGTPGGDRTTFKESISPGLGPQLGDAWNFAGDAFNGTSLADGAGPWRNSARWRYMTSDEAVDYAYSSPDDFTDFSQFVSGTTWQNPPEYQQVRISDRTLHPGQGQAVVAWESDFDAWVRYEFNPYMYQSAATDNYQVLWWDADGGPGGAGMMNVLWAREELGLGEAPVVGMATVGVGDLLYFVLDSRNGDFSNDRIQFDATITVVPEPATAALALLALLGAVVLCRRRKP